jgi:uncharacterized phage protein (TIGR02218 family)
MRAIPSALQAALDSGVATLCRCWRLARNDGIVLGFTDHDEDISFDGVTHRAGTGFTASEATERLGLQVDGTELSGALADDSLAEADLAAGRYDGAGAEVWLVDWSAPASRMLLSAGVLGEVRREGASFVAELRSLADRLNRKSGALFTPACAADFGDARCGVDLDVPAVRGVGAVAQLAGAAVFTASGLAGYADGWFTRGRLTFSSGANAGLAAEVKLHRADAAGVTLALWQAMPEPIASGDAFVVTAGCDKRFATCRDRFANVVNFRGFPHIPGNDFVIGYAVAGEPGRDGNSLAG